MGLSKLSGSYKPLVIGGPHLQDSWLSHKGGGVMGEEPSVSGRRGCSWCVLDEAMYACRSQPREECGPGCYGVAQLEGGHR